MTELQSYSVRLGIIKPVGYVTVLVVCAALSLSNVVASLDIKLLDAEFRLLRAYFPRSATKDVIVVGIDETTVKQFPEPVTLWHPHLGKFLEAMAMAKAAVVGLDVVLPDRSYDRVVPGYDKTLLAGLLAARKALPVVIALTVDQAGQTRPIYAPFVSVAGRDSLGFALLPFDSDQMVRRFDERLGDKGETVATLVGQMARRMNIGLSSGLIDYSIGPGFSYVPLQIVNQWLEKGDATQLSEVFSGKPVVLGSVLPFEDRLRVPVNLAAWEHENGNIVPGVLVHAQALRSLLGRGLIGTVPSVWVFALSMVASLLWFASLKPFYSFLVVIAFTVFASAMALVLLREGWYLPLSAILLSAYLAASARAMVDAALQIRERRRLRRAFAGYVSPQIMAEILAGRFRLGLGGVRQRVCVLFADIRSFTARSEASSPEAVIALLNRYFEEVTFVIHDEQGTVASFMGDGIMAIFGAPNPSENPCISAFAAARRMLGILPALNRSLQAEGEQPIEIGIGLHVGDAIVGHVGSKSRHEYTAIGDTTNLASRLEGLTKDVGYPLVCSKPVVEALGQATDFAFLGERPIKGHSPIEVYGWKD